MLVPLVMVERGRAGVLVVAWWWYYPGVSGNVVVAVAEHSSMDEERCWGKTPRFLFSSASILLLHQPIGHPSQSLQPSPSLHTISPPISISYLYLSKMQNVFVWISKCICPNCKTYLSPSPHTISPPISISNFPFSFSYSLTEKLVDWHCAPLLQKDAWAQAAHQETVRESLSKKSKKVKKS